MTYRVVVSAENRPYIAWQAKLAHYSCVSRLGQAPLIVVHELDGAELPEWAEIEAAGGSIIRAPSYRLTPAGVTHEARNTIGTLIEAAAVITDAEWLLLCDPDMIIASAPECPAVPTAGAYGYMHYGTPGVRAAARRIGVSAEQIAAYGDDLCCGVPYFIRAADAAGLARAWLEALDAFEQPEWIDIMHAYGLAVASLGLEQRRSPGLMQTTLDPDAPLSASVLHYPYEAPFWDKKWFVTAEESAAVWRPPEGAKAGSVMAEVMRQLKEAGEFYSQLGKLVFLP